jgi:hypothetical protein
MILKSQHHYQQNREKIFGLGLHHREIHLKVSTQLRNQLRMIR